MAGLEDQNADEHKSEDGVARSKNAEAVFAANVLGIAGSGCIGVGLDNLSLAVVARRDDAQTLDDVGDVDNDAAHVKDQAGAVEEHVRFGGLVQLRDEAKQAGANDDVENAADEGRRGVQKFQVTLEQVKVGIPGVGRLGEVPKNIVVVGERGEDDAQEEAGGCARESAGCWRRRRQDSRPTMRKVAKELALPAMTGGDRGSDLGWR